MAGRIELPDLIQSIKVKTDSFLRGKRDVADFATDVDASLDKASDSTDEYNKKVKETESAHRKRREEVKKDRDWIRRLGEAFRDTGKNAEDSGVVLASFATQLKLPVIAAGISAVGGAVSALGASIFALGAQIGPVVGLTASLPVLGSAMASVGIVAKTSLTPGIEAFKALEEGKNDVEALGKALADMTDEERKFAFALRDAKSQWDSLSDSLAENNLPAFQESLTRVTRLLPTLQVGLEDTGTAVQGVLEDITDLVTSPSFRDDLQTLFIANTTIIENLGETGKNLIDVLRNITLAAIPMTTQLSQIASIGSINLAEKIEAARASGEMEAFFGKSLEVGRQLGNAFKDFAGVLYNIGVIANESLGINFVQNMQEGAARWLEFTQSVDGAAKIEDYFSGAAPVMQEVWGLIKDIISALVGLGDNQDLADFIRQIREEVLPSFVELAEGVTPRVADLIVNVAQAFLEFSDMLSFSPLIELVAQLAGALAVLTETISDIPGLGPFVASILALNAAFKGFNIARMLFGIGGPTPITSGLGKITAAVSGATGAIGKFKAGAGALVGAFSPWGLALAGAAAALGAFAQAQADSKARVSDLTNAMREQQGVATEGVFKSIAENLDQGFVDRLEYAGFAMEDYLKAVVSAKDPEEALADLFATTGHEIEDNINLYYLLKKNLEDRRNEIGEAQGALDRMAAAERAAATAAEESAAATDKSTAASRELREELALTNAEYDKLIGKLEIVNAEFLAGLSDQADYYDALDSLRESAEEGFTLDVKTEEGRADVRALVSFVNTAQEDIRAAFEESPEAGVDALQAFRTDIENVGISVDDLDKVLANDRKLNLQTGKAAILGEIAEIEAKIIEFEDRRAAIQADIEAQEDLLGSAVPEYLKQNARDRIAELKEEKVELRADMNIGPARKALEALKETTKNEKIELGAKLVTGGDFKDSIAELVKAKQVKVKPEVDPKSKKGAQDEIENDVKKKNGKTHEAKVKPVIDPESKNVAQTILDALTAPETKTITAIVVGSDGKPFNPSDYSIAPQQSPVPRELLPGGGGTTNQTNNYNVNVNAGSSTITDQGLTNKLRRIRA